MCAGSPAWPGFAGWFAPRCSGRRRCRPSCTTFQQNHDYEGSTLNQAVCAVRLFFRDHLGRADWTCWAQIRIKRNAPIPTVLSREEARVLPASVNEPRFVAVFSLMYHCGLRLGEACRMEVTHLDRERGVLRVLNGKGGRNREVPVSPEMFVRLERWWQRHRNPRFLFPGLGRGCKDRRGGKMAAMHGAEHPMSEAGVQQAMKAAVLASRLKKTGICCHALRHSYATHLLEEGVSVRQLQSYLGHSSIEVTAKYLHLTSVSETKVQEAAAGTLRSGKAGHPFPPAPGAIHGDEDFGLRGHRPAHVACGQCTCQGRRGQRLAKSRPQHQMATLPGAKACARRVPRFSSDGPRKPRDLDAAGIADDAGYFFPAAPPPFSSGKSFSRSPRPSSLSLDFGMNFRAALLMQ